MPAREHSPECFVSALDASHKLRRFPKSVLPVNLLAMEDYEWLEDYGLPNADEFNSSPECFVTIALEANARRLRSYKLDRRVVVSRGITGVVCVGPVERSVTWVDLTTRQAEIRVNSCLPRYVACHLVWADYLELRQETPDDWELAEKQAREFLRQLRLIDPDILDAPGSYWEEWIINAGYGEPLDWR